MTEWGVVGVIVVLLGVVATIVTPILKLNSSVTRMTVLIDRLDYDHKNDMRENSESHRRLWKHNDEQDKAINDHEKRIHTLERK